MFTQNVHVRTRASALYAGDSQIMADVHVDKPNPSGHSDHGPSWTENLKPVGVYFEGILDDADNLLLEHTNASYIQSPHMELEHPGRSR